MANEVVYTGAAANDGTGDRLRTAFTRLNAAHVTEQAARIAEDNTLRTHIANVAASYTIRTWATGQSYGPGTVGSLTDTRDIVFEEGEWHVAAVDHVAGVSFSTDKAAGKWLTTDPVQLRGDLATAGTGKGADMVRWVQSGLGSVTRSVDSKLRETVSTADKGAAINSTANDTEAVQAAVSNHTQVVATTGTSIVGAVTLPSANTKFTLQGVFAALANDVTQMQFIADTSRTNVRVMDGGGKFTANGKTGATGVRLGSVTNNPSTGAEEAALYVGFRDLLFTGYQTGVDLSLIHI